ncbi:MAG: orotate phosphoribosyltransferase [Candidatus Woesearchaeota archaeon]
MGILKEKIALILLENKAVTLNADEPYTFVSGIRSPIYCDNRILTFYPEARRILCQAFNGIVSPLEVDVIAGTASSAISWAAWTAQKLEKPMVYIRKKEKDYGKEKLVEGGDIKGKKIVVIEDLVSTGGSSINAVQACREAGAEVVAMVAIFTYEFEKSKRMFEEAGCKTFFLTDFGTLARVAAENNFLDKKQLAIVREWNRDAQAWGPKHGFALGEKKN